MIVTPIKTRTLNSAERAYADFAADLRISAGDSLLETIKGSWGSENSGLSTLLDIFYEAYTSGTLADTNYGDTDHLTVLDAVIGAFSKYEGHSFTRLNRDRKSKDIQDDAYTQEELLNETITILGQLTQEERSHLNLNIKKCYDEIIHDYGPTELYPYLELAILSILVPRSEVTKSKANSIINIFSRLEIKNTDLLKSIIKKEIEKLIEDF